MRSVSKKIGIIGSAIMIALNFLYIIVLIVLATVDPINGISIIYTKAFTIILIFCLVITIASPIATIILICKSDPKLNYIAGILELVICGFLIISVIGLILNIISFFLMLISGVMFCSDYRTIKKTINNKEKTQ